MLGVPQAILLIMATPTGAVDSKVSCSQIPRRAFGRDSNPRPSGWESDILTIRPWRSTTLHAAMHSVYCTAPASDTKPTHWCIMWLAAKTIDSSSAVQFQWFRGASCQQWYVVIHLISVTWKGQATSKNWWPTWAAMELSFGRNLAKTHKSTRFFSNSRRK
jgi:hypothetical protein